MPQIAFNLIDNVYVPLCCYINDILTNRNLRNFLSDVRLHEKFKQSHPNYIYMNERHFRQIDFEPCFDSQRFYICKTSHMLNPYCKISSRSTCIACVVMSCYIQMHCLVCNVRSLPTLISLFTRLHITRYIFSMFHVNPYLG